MDHWYSVKGILMEYIGEICCCGRPVTEIFLEILFT
jgi:hypothetical protein